MGKLSPMMQQYKEIKAQYEDYILFYRIGDFYEMFFDDALTASRELELTLTGRDCGLEERAPMCGVPYHACDVYLKKLVEKGYKVAICEQMESPYEAKGVVKREVIRITTPGTIVEGSMLPEGENNYIASVYYDPSGFGVCFADVSTGEARFTQYTGPEPERGLVNELSKFAPKELLINPGFSECAEARDFVQSRLRCVVDPVEETEYQQKKCARVLTEQFGREQLEKLELQKSLFALYAAAALVSYLQETQKSGAKRLTTLTWYSNEQYLSIDFTARKNLELTETLRSREKRGSLLWVLDKTRTAMGKRLMRKFLEQPLASVSQITRRQSAVAELADKTLERAELIEGLGDVYDLERLMTKVVYGTVTPRELLSLSYTAGNLPRVKQAASVFQATLLRELYGELDTLEEMKALIDCSIDEEAPVNRKDGGYIKMGYRPELDELKDIQKNAKGYLAKIEERERERTGIKNLRVSYNRVFGYYIEVTKSFLSQVPPDYIRKQTLTGSERYITEELKELESKVLYASDRMIAMEAELYDEICKQVAASLPVIERTAAAVAQLDVLASLAQVAVDNHYVRPELSANGEIRILEGRHPVVEAMFPQTPFVPNDTMLDSGANLVAVITGPNMAGKSTYMRQVALICIMAQMGSFVPARSATVPILDKVFTRVGASDDLTAGQSTFMVEMSEVAYILQNATPQSLILLDEIGRGTSTFDGMSIAKAVVEYILKEKKIHAKTLFATHYHELTELENQYDGVVNYNIAVKKRGDDVIFLRKILRGGADDSYGIEVAKLAGVPDKVIKRAKVILTELEKSVRKPSLTYHEEPETEQISFSEQSDVRAADALRKMDVDSMSPREALDALYELKAMLM
ncbi:MAG TPA: DNA mismatch repair protein MutS [Candidatus Merdivicinus intestinavium]|nr:DNA mismatch repair protein MutS [Candidatus Merdivicinus intestinavium]